MKYKSNGSQFDTHKKIKDEDNASFVKKYGPAIGKLAVLGGTAYLSHSVGRAMGRRDGPFPMAKGGKVEEKPMSLNKKSAIALGVGGLGLAAAHALAKSGRRERDNTFERILQTTRGSSLFHAKGGEIKGNDTMSKNLAIAYAMKRKQDKKMAKGGEVEEQKPEGMSLGKKLAIGAGGYGAYKLGTIMGARRAGTFAGKAKDVTKSIRNGGKKDGPFGYDEGGQIIDQGAAQGVQDSFRKATHYDKGGEVHSCPSCGYAEESPKDNDGLSALDEMSMYGHDMDVTNKNDRKNFQNIKQISSETGLPKYEDGGFIGSEQSDDHEYDMVDDIMRQKESYSKGGQIANDDHQFESDFDDPNEFDDLVLRDNDMEGADYTGANSGDEIGCEGEDERRSDIVSKIMSSRKKKDRNPRPA